MTAKSQYDKVKDLFKDQFKAVLGSIQDKQEADKLIEDHFWDKDHPDYIPAEHIDFKQGSFQEIKNSKARLIWVALRFQICTISELAADFRTSRATIRRIYSATLKSL